MWNPNTTKYHHVFFNRVAVCFSQLRARGTTEDGVSFSIADMSYNDNTYYMVLVEEGNQETGIFIRSSLVPELEIILPLPQIIRVNYDETLPGLDDLV